MTNARDRISYGTPEQLASLFASVRVNVEEEPDDMFDHPAVRREAAALADALTGRLERTVGEHQR